MASGEERVHYVLWYDPGLAAYAPVASALTYVHVATTNSVQQVFKSKRHELGVGVGVVVWEEYGGESEENTI